MTTILLAFAKKYWSQSALAAFVVAAFFAYSAHERQVGRLQIQLRSADSLLAVAAKDSARFFKAWQIDSSRAAHLEADTAKANQSYRRARAQYAALTGPLNDARHRLDSLMALHPDTASTGLPAALATFEAKSDSTIKACNGALVAADSALTACQDHAKALQASLWDTKGMLDAANKSKIGLGTQVKALSGNQQTVTNQAIKIGIGVAIDEAIRAILRAFHK